MIDPFFRPDRRQWTDTIEICASLLGRRGFQPLQGIIEIHTGDPSNRRSPADEFAAWDSSGKRRQFAPNYRHTLSVAMYKQFDDGERVHDRFLITDQVGLSIAGGLDCVRPAFGTPSDTIWTLMDEKDCQLWLSKFRLGTESLRQDRTLDDLKFRSKEITSTIIPDPSYEYQSLRCSSFILYSPAGTAGLVQMNSRPSSHTVVPRMKRGPPGKLGLQKTIVNFWLGLDGGTSTRPVRSTVISTKRLARRLAYRIM